MMTFSWRAAACAWLVSIVCSHAAFAQETAAEPAPDTKTTKPRAAKSRASAEVTTGSLEEESEKPAGPKVRITRSRPKADTSPAQAGWNALAAGDLPKARAHYERALKNDALNIDALLGLAHIAARQNHPQLAQSFLQRALDAHPRHPEAQALSLALTGRADPLASESALKTLIAAQPGTASAHFALGGVLAQSGRWQDAQDAFFRAWSIEPDNADYQYNLAVSLDHLNQPLLARDHYKGALEAATKRAAAFDAKLAQTRILTLSAPPATPKDAPQ